MNSYNTSRLNILTEDTISDKNVFLNARRNGRDLSYIIWPVLIEIYFFYLWILGNPVGRIYFPLGLIGLALFALGYYTDGFYFASVLNGKIQNIRDMAFVLLITTVLCFVVWFFASGITLNWLPIVAQCPKGAALNLTSSLCTSSVGTSAPQINGISGSGMSNWQYLITFMVLTVTIETLALDAGLFPSFVSLLKRSTHFVAGFSAVAALIFAVFLNNIWAAFVFAVAAAIFGYSALANKELAKSPVALMAIGLLMIGSVQALYHVPEYSTFANWLTISIAAGAFLMGAVLIDVILESTFPGALLHATANGTIIVKMLAMASWSVWIGYFIYVMMIVLFDLFRNKHGELVNRPIAVNVHVQR